MAEHPDAKTMTNLLIHSLLKEGASLVAIGDLTELPPQIRADLPYGISIAVKFPQEVIKGISQLPTAEYYAHYNRINKKLDCLAQLAAAKLESWGYKALAQTSDYVNKFAGPYSSLLPHKTVATRAGLGFIGKNALLTNQLYGSAIRLTSVLTDAPLELGQAINQGQCGDCQLCRQDCPAQAIKGNLWDTQTSREDLVDVVACEKTARARSFLSFGADASICGKCIEICPYSQEYLNRSPQQEKAIEEKQLLQLIENIPSFAEGSIGDYGLWFEELEEHYSPLRINDLTDMDNQEVYSSSYLISMTPQVKGTDDENFDRVLAEGQDVYFFNIEISEEKPLAYVDFWRYFQSDGFFTNNLEVSSEPFLTEQNYFLDLFKDFAFKHNLLLLSKEETEIALENTTVYKKHFREN